MTKNIKFNKVDDWQSTNGGVFTLKSDSAGNVYPGAATSLNSRNLYKMSTDGKVVLVSDWQSTNGLITSLTIGKDDTIYVGTGNLYKSYID